MKRASITDAKNGLSALLERVRRGETVLIEDRGVAVAALTPVAASGGVDADRLAALARAGVVQPGAGSSKASSKLVSRPPKPGRAVSLSRLVIEERENGR